MAVIGAYILYAMALYAAFAIFGLPVDGFFWALLTPFIICCVIGAGLHVWIFARRLYLNATGQEWVDPDGKAYSGPGGALSALASFVIFGFGHLLCGAFFFAGLFGLLWLAEFWPHPTTPDK